VNFKAGYESAHGFEIYAYARNLFCIFIKQQKKFGHR